MKLLLSIACFAVFPNIVSAQQLAVNGADQLWRSKDLDNRFYGRFFPPTDIGAPNFFTCKEETIRVLSEEVEPVDVVSECPVWRSPFDTVSWSELNSHIVGLQVLTSDSEVIGNVAEVILLKTGQPAGFLIETGDYLNSVVSIRSLDFSVWDTEDGYVGLVSPNQDIRTKPLSDQLLYEGLDGVSYRNIDAATDALINPSDFRIKLSDALDENLGPLSDGYVIWKLPPQLN